jgi:hypothetical protein
VITGQCALPEPNTLKTYIGDFAENELANTFTDLARVSGLLPKTPFFASYLSHLSEMPTIQTSEFRVFVGE